MTTDRSSIVRSAFRLLSPRWIAMQIALAMLVFVLFVVWLRVPDASVISISLSLLLALVLLVLVCGGEAYLLQRLNAQAVSRRRVLVGGVAILLGVALAIGWNTVLDHFAENHSLWAGYLNSRFPAGLRNLFSYPHIYQGLRWLWALLSWLGEGFFAAVVVAFIVTEHPSLAARTILRSVTFWAAILLGSALLTGIFNWISDWTPGHGLFVESLSLFLRMVVILLVEGSLASFILAITVAAAQRSETLGGTPVESQPRTVVMP